MSVFIDKLDSAGMIAYRNARLCLCLANAAQSLEFDSSSGCCWA